MTASCLLPPVFHGSSSTVARRLLGESAEARDYIVTVPRCGYRFVADVKKITKTETLSSSASAATTARRHPVIDDSNAPTLAVLPFKLLISSAGDEYLGVGLTDALITRLSNIRQIVVRPTSAVLKYAGAVEDVMAARRALGVAAVLEGSVRRAGQRLRVTVQLVRVEDGRTLWADKFDEPFTDLFAVEDRITERVAAALALRLTNAERARLAKRHTVSSEAHEYYLKGRYYANRWVIGYVYGMMGQFDQSVAAFEQAARLDWSPMIAGQLGCVYAMAGRRDDARAARRVESAQRFGLRAALLHRADTCCAR